MVIDNNLTHVLPVVLVHIGQGFFFFFGFSIIIRTSNPDFFFFLKKEEKSVIRKEKGTLLRVCWPNFYLLTKMTENKINEREGGIKHIHILSILLSKVETSKNCGMHERIINYMN